MPESNSTAWKTPFSKLLLAVNWRSGMEPVSSESDEELPMQDTTAVLLPEKPLLTGFAMLLRSIPWKGRPVFVPKNRIKEVLP